MTDAPKSRTVRVGRRGGRQELTPQTRRTHEIRLRLNLSEITIVESVYLGAEQKPLATWARERLLESITESTT